MDNGYRAITLNDDLIAEAGDQALPAPRGEWQDIHADFVGEKYIAEDFEDAVWRRPIAQDHYATPTDRIVEHYVDDTNVVDITKKPNELLNFIYARLVDLYGEKENYDYMLALRNYIDATSNAPDEWPSETVNAPYSSVSEIPADLMWLIRAIDSFPSPNLDLVVGICDAPEGYTYEIFPSGWLLINKSTRKSVLNYSEWQCAKKLLSDEVAISKTETGEWVDGLPPIGTECEFEIVRDEGRWEKIYICGKDSAGDLVFEFLTGDTDSLFDSVSFPARFRPTLTPAQAEERERAELISGIDKAINSALENDQPMSNAVYDWLKSTDQLKDKSK